MKEKPKQQDYEHVELILKEANAYGLKYEVEQTAQKYLNQNPKLDLVTAYQWGYEEWIK
tara:strand:- start:781 stop:957 length:177 start_codon:yes stop_codon:yes gene_type:complete